MSFVILVTARSFKELPGKHHQILQDLDCEVRWNPYDRPLREDELLDLLNGVDGMIAGQDEITRKVIEYANRLKVISKHGVGVDNIDLSAAKARGIIVCNTPGTNSISVAELAIAFIFVLSRSIVTQDCNAKAGLWKRVMGEEITGSSLGIIGLGRIGKEVSKRARCLEMNVLVFDSYFDKEFANKFNIAYAGLDELLIKSNYISLHVPLTAETKNLLNREKLQLISSSSYLINTARSELVDEKALYDLLKEKKIAGAGLDVISANSLLLTLDNVIATPHIGGCTTTAIENTGIIAAQNIVNVLQQKEPLYRV